MIKVITVPCLYDNYAYIVFNPGSHEAVIIDPSESWPLMREINEQGLILKAILCTHHHQDHIGGLDELVDEYPNIEIVGFQGDTSRIPMINRALGDGETFSACGVEVKMEHTPGHTSGGVVYHLQEHLFTGDTLFGAGCGRLFEGSPEQLMGSLQRIINRNHDTKLYFGHEYTLVNLNFAAQIEPDSEDIKERILRVTKIRNNGIPSTPSTIAEELRTNPFLRCGDTLIASYLEQGHDLVDRSPLNVFTLLRALRNNFS